MHDRGGQIGDQIGGQISAQIDAPPGMKAILFSAPKFVESFGNNVGDDLDNNLGVEDERREKDQRRRAMEN